VNFFAVGKCGSQLYDFVTFVQTIGEVLPFNRERVATMVVRDVSEQFSWFSHECGNIVRCNWLMFLYLPFFE
jgi:hypothetical protein